MSQAQQSFDRIVKVKVFATNITNNVLPNSPPTIDYNSGYTTFPSKFPDGSPGFRIKGRINRLESAISYDPNLCSFSIYNLGKNSRALLESQLGTLVVIEAGYGQNSKQILSGNIRYARTHKQNSDYITDVLLADGGYVYNNAFINRSFKGSTSYSSVIYACIAALSDYGITPGWIQDIPEGNYNQGHVLTGNPADELFKVCDKLDLSCSIQSGQVQIHAKSNSRPLPALNLSVNTGLIGIPEVRSQAYLGDIGGGSGFTPSDCVSLKMLLTPEIVVGQTINLKSLFLNGLFTAARLTHEFDSWEGPFYTSAECTRIPNI